MKNYTCSEMINHLVILKSKFFLAIIFCFFVFNVWGQTTVPFTTTGAGTWTVPCDVTSITVEIWGSGGGGQRANGNPSAGGGGSGGGFIRSTYAVTPGTLYNLYVGNGGSGNSGVNGEASWFVNNTTFLAIGGRGAGPSVTNNNTWGGGALAFTSGNIGGTLVTTYGGNGGNAGNNFSGGGGSSAGNTNGNNASGLTAGIAPTNGFAGATGSTGNADGVIGGVGAGGAGGRTGNGTDRLGGAGGRGEIRITYTSALRTYCSPTFTSAVEPITNVTFAGINRTTSATVGGTPALESFCDVGNVQQGASYTMSLKGNTDGDFIDYFRVYIDWDQNGTFGNNSNEIYDIGTITNSTGLDAITLIGTIAVPAGATLGTTRMRVMKNFNAYSSGPCVAHAYGQAEDYTIMVTALLPCSGTPMAGSVIVSPVSGAPGSTYSVTATGYSNGLGLTYQWQYSDTGGAPWINQGSATSSYVALSGMVAPAFGVVRTWRLVVTCTASASSANSSTGTFTSAYCTPTVQDPNTLYISSLSIVGTMADPPTNVSAAGVNGTGYSNYTGLTTIAQQAQGEGVNVLASSIGGTYGRGQWKAWVDWNGDGDFADAGEEVYTTGGVLSASANFGFAIPVTQTPGNYRMRIRVNNNLLNAGTAYDFTACDNFIGDNRYGETEDYLIKVIANCAAKITTITNGSDCNAVGGKQITLQATSSIPVTEFRWYSSATGSSYLTSLPDGTGMATTFTTPLLSATTKYYVTAVGACESTFRVEVRADVKPTPEITFTPSTLSVCGESAVVAVSATGSNEIKHLIANQTFEDGTLGLFTNQDNTVNNATINGKVNWQNRSSVYIPAAPNYLTWYPAISSGFGSNKFVMSTSDINAGQIIDKALLSPTTLDSRGLLNLTLKLKMFFSRYQDNGTFPNDEFVSIEVSTVNSNDNNNWMQIDKITSDVGYGTSFEEKTYNLNAYIGVQNLRIRIRYYANGWFDGVAVDDIELYGERPLQPSFTYTSANPIGIYTDAAGTIAYTGGPVPTVYFKPSITEMENYADWNVTATATLSNSCNAQGSINIVNNTKTWNPATAITDWATNNWKQDGMPPTADKCVVIKKPVIIGAGTDALAKNIKIETTSGNIGNLNIAGSLKVTDAIETTAAADLVVASDGNLIQVNNSAPNIGSITAQKVFTFITVPAPNNRKQYNFVTSPVIDQNLKTIYAGNPTVLYHQESNNFFGNSSGAYIRGRGLAVQEPNATVVPFNTVTANFVGAPFNGILNYPLVYTTGEAIESKRGFNLTGNPYPSNLDVDKLFTANTTKISATFHFWDNRGNTQYTQYGSSYNGSNYARYNAISGMGVGAGFPASGATGGVRTPTKIVKAGTGFMVQALVGTNGQTLNFNNAMRTGDAGPAFYGKTNEAQDKDRYWLTLKTPSSMEFMTAVVYFPQGSKDFGPEDSGDSGSSDDIYTFADDKKLSIQGRDSFVTNDKINMGIKSFEAGLHTISLLDKDGVFTNGQNIYLKDKDAGIITNLSQGSYIFSATSGENNTRFEIIYELETVLATDGKEKEQIVVYRQNTDFVIKSPKELSRVEMYDTSGKLIKSLDLNSRQAVVDGSSLITGIYILKIQTEDGEIYNKKIMK